MTNTEKQFEEWKRDNKGTIYPSLEADQRANEKENGGIMRAQDEIDDLINHKIKELNGEYISFNGFNCHDLDENTCRGWDGIDRRCECGNRRVMWEYIEYLDDVVAEAY